MRERIGLRSKLLVQWQGFHDHKRTWSAGELTDLLERASRHGWSYERAIAHHLLGFWQIETDGIENVAEHYRKALALIDVETSPNRAVQVAIGLGARLRDRGDHREAREMYQRALSIGKRFAIQVHRPTVLGELSYIELRAGNLQRAESMCREALQINRRLGARAEEPGIYCMLGEVYRERGEIEEAREAYRRSIELSGEVGEGHLDFGPMINLAIVSALDDRFDEAEGYFAGVVDQVNEDNHELYLPGGLLGLACCKGASNNWERTDEKFREARQAIEQFGTVTVDFARLTERLARTAEQAERTDLAKSAYCLAIDQRRELGEEERADELDRRLEDLEKDD